MIESWDRDQDIWLARGAALETFAMRVLHALLATTSGPSRSYTADRIILESAGDGLPIAFGADVARHIGLTCTPRHARPDLSVDQPVEHLDQARLQRGHRPSATTKSP